MNCKRRVIAAVALAAFGYSCRAAAALFVAPSRSVRGRRAQLTIVTVRDAGVLLPF